MAFSCAGLLAGCADHSDVARPTATATLVNTSGATIGSAELTEHSKGVFTLKVSVKGLPTGIYGIHFREVGVADPKSSPVFPTSGEHYKPASRKHGLENPDGTHAGDLPTLIVDGQGTGSWRPLRIG